MNKKYASHFQVKQEQDWLRPVLRIVVGKFWYCGYSFYLQLWLELSEPYEKVKISKVAGRLEQELLNDIEIVSVTNPRPGLNFGWCYLRIEKIHTIHSTCPPLKHP